MYTFEKYNFNNDLLSLDDNDMIFNKSLNILNKSNKKAIAYNFLNCKFGDKIYYDEILGYNLLEGEYIGICCIEAGLLDEKPRFAYKKEINGMHIWNDAMEKCKEIQNGYLPDKDELRLAFDNGLILNFHFYYWTSTLYNSLYAYSILTYDSGVYWENKDSYYYVRPFFHIPHLENFITESFDFNKELLSFDNEDGISFNKSSQSLNNSMKKSLPLILKNIEEKTFKQLILSYLYKDKSLNGFKFNNTIYNNPVFVKYKNDMYIEGALKDNLEKNGWIALFTYGYLLLYLSNIYNYNLSDKELLDLAINNKVSMIHSVHDIEMAKKDEHYQEANQIMNLIYNDYFINILHYKDAKMGNVGLFVHELYISKNKEFFICSISNYRGTSHMPDYDLLGVNAVGKDICLIGYTGLKMPEKNEALSNIDIKLVNSFKKELSDIFSIKDPDTEEIKELVKIPLEFHTEMINGTLGLVYNIPCSSSLYGEYDWDNIFKNVKFNNKKLNNLIKYRINYHGLYIDDKELREKFMDENENLPRIIKAPFDPKYVCLLYNIYNHGDSYLKIVLLDNRDYHLGNDHHFIMHSKSSRQWYGW